MDHGQWIMVEEWWTMDHGQWWKDQNGWWYEHSMLEKPMINQSVSTWTWKIPWFISRIVHIEGCVGLDPRGLLLTQNKTVDHNGWWYEHSMLEKPMINQSVSTWTWKIPWSISRLVHIEGCVWLDPRGLLLTQKN